MASALGTLLGMAKKKPVPEPVPDAHKGIQINLRVIDERLIAAVDKRAGRERRSRNLMLNILIERALEADGDWPPKP